MDVTGTINLPKQEESELAEILGCNTEELQKQLSKYASASLQEYISMFLGKKVFKRGADILEYRLFLLIEEAFSNKVPDEQDVCKLFQSTSTDARSLIRSVISKYQYQLKPALDNTIKEILESASKENGKDLYTVTINSRNIVEELNRQLAGIDGSLTPVTKKRSSVSIYEIKASSYAKLRTKYCSDNE